MTTNPSVQKIMNDPKYRELVRKRSAFAWFLTALILIVYYGFIFLIAYDPGYLGTPLSEGSVTTIGLPLGVAVIVISILLTGVYVRRANGEFDDLTKQLIDGAK
jgi:uncharacterized membrane protein (DUF485 family)